MGNSPSAEASRDRPSSRAPSRSRSRPPLPRLFSRSTPPPPPPPPPPPEPAPHRLSKPRTRSRSRARSLAVPGLFRKRPDAGADAGQRLPPAVAGLATADRRSQHPGSAAYRPHSLRSRPSARSPYSPYSPHSPHSPHSPYSDHDDPVLDRPLPALPPSPGGTAARRSLAAAAAAAATPLSPSRTPRSFLFTFDDGPASARRDSGVVWQPLAADRGTALALPPLSFPVDDLAADVVGADDEDNADDADDDEDTNEQRRQQQIQHAYRQLERRPQVRQPPQPPALLPSPRLAGEPGPRAAKPARPARPHTPLQRRRSRWSLIGLYIRGDGDDTAVDDDTDDDDDDDDDDSVAVPAARPTRKHTRRLQKRSTVFPAVHRVDDMMDGAARPGPRRRHSMAAAMPSPGRRWSFSGWDGGDNDAAIHDMDDDDEAAAAATTDDQILRRHYGAWPLHAAPPPAAVRTLWNYDLSSYAAKRLLHLVDDGGGGGGGGGEAASSHGSSAASAPPRSPALASADPMLYVPVRRRSLVQVPGVATRRASMVDGLVAGGAWSLSGMADAEMPSMPAAPPMTRPSTPRPVTPQRPAPDADADADYRAIGAFKLGSLHITNGAASPASPASGRRRRRRPSQDSEERPASEEKTAAATEPPQIPQIELSDDVFAGFEFCAAFALDEGGGGAVQPAAPVVDAVDDVDDAPRLETTSKAMAVDDRLFDLDGEGDGADDAVAVGTDPRTQARAPTPEKAADTAETTPAAAETALPLRASGSTASKASTASTASSASSSAASAGTAVTAATAATTASSSATLASPAAVAVPPPPVPLPCPVSIFATGAHNGKRHTVAGLLWAGGDDHDNGDGVPAVPASQYAVHRSSMPVSVSASAEAAAARQVAHAARWAVKTDHGADDGWRWRGSRGGAPDPARGGDDGPRWTAAGDATGRSNSLGTPCPLPLPSPSLPLSPPLRHRASYDDRTRATAAVRPTHPTHHRPSTGARPGAAATPYRVLHSYNSPAYRGVPIWG